eukprot:8904530-Alexandrium_andersonii.AAC.1
MTVTAPAMLMPALMASILFPDAPAGPAPVPDVGSGLAAAAALSDRGLAARLPPEPAYMVPLSRRCVCLQCGEARCPIHGQDSD